MKNPVRFAVACALMSAAAVPALSLAQNSTAATNPDDSGLQEVLVTANKRGAESLLDTPMAIQAITGDQLASQGIVQFADYARSISGLAFEDQGPGDKKIVLRGLDSTGAATTGLYFDDIVVTANNPQDGGGRQPDIQLVDMERLEVLKGPQGTLYGASSMAGTVRMLTNKPDPTKVTGTVNVGTGTTDGGHGANYKYDATLNLPVIADRLAVRVVGYGSDNKGWINNWLINEHGVNNDKIAGGRVALRWLINDDATLDAMYLHQTTSTIGPAWYQPQFGEFNQVYNSPAPWSESLDAYNTALNWKVGAGTVTATLSRMRRAISYEFPGSRILCTLFGGTHSTCFDYDNATLTQYRSAANEPQTRTITSSEIRYASAWSLPVQLVGGLFFDNEENDFLSQVLGENPDYTFINTRPTTYSNRFVHNSVKQYAAFGELTYEIVHGLSVTGGFRAFKFGIGQRSQNLPTFSRALAQPVVLTSSDERSATYKGNIQYKFDSGPLVYFTFSQGFRSGGNNEPDFATGTVLPPYASDSLNSYELGAKGKFFHNTIEADLAVYDMEWSNLQQRISAGIPGSSTLLIANVGSARIRGGELGLNAKPLAGVDFVLGANATVLKDTITQAAVGVNNLGDRVPNIPQFTTNVFADYGFPVFGWDGSARAEYQYVGDSYSDFNRTRPVYTRQGDYSLVNFRLNFERDAYRVQAYVDNAFNTVGIITTTIDVRRPVEAYATRPRTVGVELSYKF